MARFTPGELLQVRARLESDVCMCLHGPIPDNLYKRVRRVRAWMGEEQWRLTTLMYMSNTARLGRRQSIFSPARP